MKKFSMIYILLLFFIQSCSLIKSYPQEEIKFTSGDITLSGTLILPDGDGPFPLVIFVHGSGAETRDNSFYSAKWFASIGYAAFTYDKRGAGESGGSDIEISYFSFDVLANDLLAAVDTLGKMDKIDDSRIGLHASSQGGWVAPLAASRSDHIKFMIIRAASVVSVSEDRIYERGERLTGEGFNESDLLEVREIQVLEGKPVDDPGYEKFNQLYEEYKNKKWFPRVYGEADLEELEDYRAWYATVADFNPIVYLKMIDIPVIWLFGDPLLDKLGPIEKSIRNVVSLKNDGADFTVHQYEGEGHNISESSYERDLFNWLVKANKYDRYDFKRH